MPLPDASRIRALGLPGLGDGADELIDLRIAAADAVLADRCHFPWTTTGTKTLESSDYVEYYRKPDSDPRRLTLGLHPVTVTALATDTNGDLTYATSADVSTDLVVDAFRGVVWIKPTSTFTFATGLRANKVTAAAGWDVGNEPALVQAIGMLVAHWQAVGQIGMLLTGATSQGSTAQYREIDLPKAVLALLGPYTLHERETHWDQL